MNGSITAALRMLVNDTERLLINRLRPLDLTVPQLRFLADFAANPDHSGADAARASHLSPQTGTIILQNLILKQFITVQRVPGTGNRHKVTVTDCGKDVLNQALEAIAGVEKLLADLLGDNAAIEIGNVVTALQPHLPSSPRRPRIND